MAKKPDHDLERAYSIETPDDAIDLYRGWADSYDRTFAEAMGYIAPREIAGLYKETAGGEQQPILDIGAGTGIVAGHLAGWTVDAIDISAPMLEQAGEKGLYRERIVADLTQPLDIASERYGGFVSSGTFTHGHVGPVCLSELLRIAKPSALFCVGVNPVVFDQAGFGSALALLVAEGRITPVDFKSIPIYENADHAHAHDRGLVALFRKSGPV